MYYQNLTQSVIAQNVIYSIVRGIFSSYNLQSKRIFLIKIKWEVRKALNWVIEDCWFGCKEAKKVCYCILHSMPITPCISLWVPHVSRVLKGHLKIKRKKDILSYDSNGIFIHVIRNWTTVWKMGFNDNFGQNIKLATKNVHLNTT